MNSEEQIHKLLDYVADVEKNFNEAETKQLVCILISRLLNPLSSKETAELIIGLAEIEQQAIDYLEEKDNNKLH
jgi:hypothetical protein